MHRRLRQLGGPVFGGMVSHPNRGLDEPIATATEPEEHEELISDLSIVARLRRMQSHPALSGEEARQLHGHLNVYEAWESEAAEWERGFIAKDEARLKSRHKELRAQGRELLERLQKAEGLYKGAQAILATVLSRQDAEVSKLREMKALEAKGKHLRPWPNDQEIAGWQGLLKAQEKKIIAANEQSVVATHGAQVAEAELTMAQLEYNELIFEEVRVRHLLDGKPYFDPELGLADRPAFSG
jgi:chromosome segregation ATPase